MAETHAFVVVGSTIRRGDDSLVVRTLKSNESSTAVLLEFADDYSAIPECEGRLTAVLEQIEGSEIEPKRTAFPFVFQNHQADHQLVVMSISMENRVSLVTIQQLAEFPSPWEDSVVSTTSETVLSTIRRAVVACQAPRTWKELSGELEKDIGRINSIFLSNVSEGITHIARDSFANNQTSNHSRRGAFERILDVRSRLQNATAHLDSNELGATQMAHGLRAAVAGCDASTTSLAAMVAVVMQEQNAEQETRDLKRERKLVERDRFIAKVAAALLLPGLWFGFLGTNVFPPDIWGWEVQSEISALIALAAGLGLGSVGWFVIPRKVSP